jgi:hypothetical protein
MRKMALAFSVSILLTATIHFAAAKNLTTTGMTSQSHQAATSSSSQADHHAQHHAEMNKRGDKAMGFSQEKTTHHFLLFADGGAIEVRANDSKDGDSINQIRMHLSHITVMFAEGNFSIPMLVHDELPPGAKVMGQMKSAIAYKFEEVDNGGRVRLISQNQQALTAIYEFLRYQIKEHQTGDSLEIGKQ